MQTKNPTPGEIQRVADHLVVRKTVKEKSGLHAISDCPACGKAKHLYLNLETGGWDCKRCGESGGLFKLADHLGLRVRERSVVRSSTAVMMSGLQQTSGVKLKRKARGGIPIDKVEDASARLFDPEDEDGVEVRAYLATRGIDDEAIDHFKLGVAYLGGSRKELAVGIPFIADGRVSMVKMRNLATDKSKRKYQRTKGGDSTLLNADGVRGRKRVVLVEGELDAVSLWQCGITEAASTSLGAKGDVPQEWKELLIGADEIVLWYDDDVAGDEAVEGLATALGSHRVRIATIPDEVADEVRAKTGKVPKDANDLVVAGIDRKVIQGICNAAIGLDTANIIRPSALADEVHRAIELGEESLGESTGSLQLDRLVRGWRPGELTIITGHTRHGKTTFATFLLEALARRDLPVLLSSLEDGPPALFRKLFQRRFGRPISTIKTDEDRQRAYEVLEQIDRWPIYILNHFGRTPFERIFDDARFAVHRLGTKFLLIDHLGFIGHHKPGFEREHLDDVLMSLREMAEELGVHIMLIAHPRGAVEEHVVPDAGSIKGTSGAKQIAHNGITVFRSVDPLGDATKGKTKLKVADGRRLEIELDAQGVLVLVWKVRHDEAREGHAIMSFDGRNLAYRDTISVPGPDNRAGPEKAEWGNDADAAFEDDDPFGQMPF